jgi:ABC-type antimicrobial peptide transport system permease subunit
MSAITFTPLKQQVEATLVQERVLAMLAGFFGALALLLAGLGLYGITWYAVSRRRNEIGVRTALGATPGGVVRLVMGHVSLLVGTGVFVGLLLSWWAMQTRRTAAVRRYAARRSPRSSGPRRC